MIRLLFICFFSLSYSSGAYAIFCQFDELYANSVVTADLITSKPGDVVGYHEFGWTTTGCQPPTPVYNQDFYISYLGKGGTTGCITTISGVYLDASPDLCSPATYGSVSTKIKLDQSFPQSGYARRNFVRNSYALPPPGNYVLKPYESKLYYLWYVGTTSPGVGRTSILLGVTQGGGTVITTCSLVNSNIVVDFGEISEAKASEPFDIEFSGCTNQADTKRFNDTVSLSFVSDQIRADGSALRNKSCAYCAKGLQIALKDGSGKPIDLTKNYKLSSNGASTISPTGLKYGFIADLQRDLDEALSGGSIDTNLTFVTTVE
ncbi:type 1 fimbria pilin [Pseudomonas sp. 3296]|uniref:fimbrial protein n=1 Tax=Pseudomonas sp. 3296 TaxID=2817753 RepID=UPI002859D457|nr:fimbrial protein [Pseudomonas sp. 3296]MDR6915967.1 type 1 fimbria pilin [Pseudomonas sp. 3296]